METLGWIGEVRGIGLAGGLYVKMIKEVAEDEKQKIKYSKL